ncbi:MAG: hypothetical protein U0271_10085 [Polyangiaceae bacterium]
MLERTVDDTTYAVAFWPVAPALIAAALAEWAHRRARASVGRRDEATAQAKVIRQVSFIAAGLLLLLGTGSAFVHGRSAIVLIFPELGLLEVGALLLTGVRLSRLAIAWSGDEARVGPFFARRIVQLAVWGLSLLGGLYPVYLLGVGAMPPLTDAWGDWVHAGYEYQLRPNSLPSGWGITGGSFKANELGQMTVDVVAGRPFLRVTRHRRLVVRAEESSPGLPLALGNKWVYEDPGERTSTFEVHVDDERMRNGIHQLRLSWREASNESDDAVWLYAVEGRTFVVAKEQNLLQRLAREPPPNDVALTIPPPGTLGAFEFPYLGWCLGVSEVRGPIGIPGPLRCRPDSWLVPVRVLSSSSRSPDHPCESVRRDLHRR